MLQVRCWLLALAGTLLGAAAAGGQDLNLLDQSDVMHLGDPAAAVGPTHMPLLPMTLSLDENGFPYPGPPYSLFSPFELYARAGAAFNIGDGQLERIVRAGKSFTGGARSFLFNHDASAAWTADLGIEYIYNNANDGEPIFTREGTTPVNRFGQTVNLPTVTQYALRELHRTSGRLALGREWYFGGDEWRGVRMNFGMDVGGKYGHVSAKLFVLERDIQGLQPFDVLPNFSDAHTSSVNKGVFVGVNSGVLLPMNGYDITFGCRFEWGQDWFLRIADSDSSLEQIQGLITVGVRY